MDVNELQQMESRQTGPITSSFFWFEGHGGTGSVGESTAGIRVKHQNEPEAGKRSVVIEVGELLQIAA